MRIDWDNAQQKAARTARWAVTMTKVRVRREGARTRWQHSWQSPLIVRYMFELVSTCWLVVSLRGIRAAGRPRDLGVPNPAALLRPGWVAARPKSWPRKELMLGEECRK